MNIGLIGRTAIAGGILGVLSGASFVALILAVLSMRDSAELARNATTELAQVAEVERILIDMESGLRGFVITGDESFLGPWTAGKREFVRKAAALARVAGHPAERALMFEIADGGRSYIDDYGTQLIASVRRNDPAAASLGSSIQGKTRSDALREQFDRFNAFGRTLLDERRNSADADFTRAVFFASTSVALTVLLIVMFAAYLARIVVRPVTRAAAMAGRLASGDMDARMPETGVAEVGALGRSFNTMADSLTASQAAQQRLLDQQSALQRVSALVTADRPPDEVFAAVTREVGENLPADVALLGRYEPDGTVFALSVWAKDGTTDGLAEGLSSDQYAFYSSVRESGTAARRQGYDEVPATLADEFRSRRLESGVACPVVCAGRLWGLLSADANPDAPLGEDAVLWMTDFASLVGTAVANATARAELTESRGRLVTASDKTRRRIERDLHDGAQQSLVALSFRLRALSADAPAEIGPDIERMARELNGVMENLRELSHGIHPAILAEGGLRPALKVLASRSTVPVELEVATDERLPEPIEVAAYYVVSEALTNTAKHANAATVHITVKRADDVLFVDVRDDGDGGADAEGSGLVGLRDRVEALGGRIEITSPRGAGTRIATVLPV